MSRVTKDIMDKTSITFLRTGILALPTNIFKTKQLAEFSVFAPQNGFLTRCGGIQTKNHAKRCPGGDFFMPRQIFGKFQKKISSRAPLTRGPPFGPARKPWKAAAMEYSMIRMAAAVGARYFRPGFCQLTVCAARGWMATQRTVHRPQAKEPQL